MATTSPLHSLAFPTLEREGLVYLDSAATSQTPQPVIDAMTDYYAHHRASVHRGVYAIAAEATDLFEGARHRIARFVNADPNATVLTRNATEAINLVAGTWARANAKAGDKLVLTMMEHHSNIVPWQLASQATGAELAYVDVDDDGQLELDELDALLAQGDVKLVAVAHVSNVLGTINDVAEVVRRAHAAGALVLVDGSQAVPQVPVDVAALGADFYVWTGHKAYGPTGVGVLHSSKALLDAMPPWLGGGHMISKVDLLESSYASGPAKFEAGTSAIAEGIGLGAAVDVLTDLGMDAVRAHELELTAYALEQLGAIDGVTLHGPPAAADRGAVVSFAVDGVHPHDVAEILGARGVCVRAGHHCAQPLMRRLGVPATTRASFAVHNQRSDVDALVAGIGRVQEVFA